MFGELGRDDKGWGLTTLGQCCELNPKRPRDINDETMVSFVPMPAVSEYGKIDCSDIRPYKEVRKGFTYFAENDVLFAKITPCMENGKGAVARELENGIGSGSTEFHVLRPIAGKSNPYWLYIITMFDTFRVGAKKVMTGTGGQLRVPIGYLNDYPISLPPIELQNSFEEFVHQSDKSKFTGFKSQFIEMFGDPVDNPMGWPMRKLSDVAKVDGTMTKEYEKYADYPHIGIDSIEKNTGILSGYRTVQEDNVISPKYYFGPQHILYSKIRPALNKVALPDFEGLCSADCYPLLVNGLCDRKFLAHVMRSDYFLDHVLSYSGRSQMPKVNRKQLEGFSFPCPPIDLQEKFTALIDQSDKSKFELKQVIADIDNLSKALMQQELS